MSYQFIWGVPPSAFQKEVDANPADFCEIVHSPGEFILDFANEDIIHSRIINSPEQAKQLLNLLENHVGEYETEHGIITVKKKTKHESYTSEIKRNLYRGHKVSPKLTIINPSRKKK